MAQKKVGNQMKKREKDYLLYYLEQLSCKLKNNISEMQQGLTHINEITKHINQIPESLPSMMANGPLSTAKLDEKPLDCLIRIKEVCLLIGVSKATIYRMVEVGTFPRPLDLGPRFKAWQKGTVVDWITSHIDT
jgi:prophage regulatory protein